LRARLAGSRRNGARFGRRGALVRPLGRLCHGRCSGAERPTFPACYEFRLDIAVDPKIRAAAETSARVYPDIIVHQPGHDRENILVIEVKKKTNSTSDDADLNKLVHIKQQIGYRHALFLRLSTGAVAAVDKVREVWV
jgi:hypothetical protein